MNTFSIIKIKILNVYMVFKWMFHFTLPLERGEDLNTSGKSHFPLLPNIFLNKDFDFLIV